MTRWQQGGRNEWTGKKWHRENKEIGQMRNCLHCRYQMPTKISSFASHTKLHVLSPYLASGWREQRSQMTCEQMSRNWSGRPDTQGKLRVDLEISITLMVMICQCKLRLLPGCQAHGTQVILAVWEALGLWNQQRAVSVSNILAPLTRRNKSGA